MLREGHGKRKREEIRREIKRNRETKIYRER